MQPEPIDPAAIAATLQDRYANKALMPVNDHVVRISVMTEPFYWHVHPDTDEAFLVVEGGLRIEIDNEAVELREGEMFMVPAGALHRTSPIGPRSVNLTFERANGTTQRKERL